MKTNIAIYLLFALALSSCESGGDAAYGESGNSNYDFWVTIEEAQEKAYDEGKYIILDVYTEWCGYCRRMNQETYADDRVQNALNDYFYPVRINAESDREVTFLNESYTMRELAMQLGATSYPTTVFLSPEGEPIAVQPGFIEANRFHKMLSFVGSESYQTTTFEEYSQSK